MSEGDHELLFDDGDEAGGGEGAGNGVGGGGGLDGKTRHNDAGDDDERETRRDEMKHVNTRATRKDREMREGRYGRG